MIVLVGVLLAVSVWVLVVGILGVLSGERVTRCRRCHRFVLTLHGQAHPKGCPLTFHQDVSNAIGAVGTTTLSSHHYRRYDLLPARGRSHPSDTSDVS